MRRYHRERHIQRTPALTCEGRASKASGGSAKLGDLEHAVFKVVSMRLVDQSHSGTGVRPDHDSVWQYMHCSRRTVSWRTPSAGDGADRARGAVWGRGRQTGVRLTPRQGFIRPIVWKAWTIGTVLNLLPDTELLECSREPRPNGQAPVHHASTAEAAQFPHSRFALNR